MTSIAFIGLGVMGGPMAANLVTAGYDVVAYDRSPDRIERFVARGGRAGGEVADAAKGVEVVITMLPDGPDVESVTLGDGGTFERAQPGTVHVDMSTISPQSALKLAAQAESRALEFLDAPVSGGERSAIEGSLSIMVGGAEEDLQRVRGILDALGSTVVHVGPHGAGQIVKAANQLVVAGVIELVAEAMVFLEAHGLDTELAMKVLAAGLAGNEVLARKGASMRARNFAPGFRVALHHKDLGILTNAARQAGVAMPLGVLVAQLMGVLVANGDGALDHTALLRLVEQLSGRGDH